MKVLGVFARFYVNDMDEAINYYENLLGEKISNRFYVSEINLEVARINNILIVAGKEEYLSEYRKTYATFLVDSINDFKSYLEDKAEIIRGPQKVPTGYNMTVKNPDGVIIEYVEFAK